MRGPPELRPPVLQEGGGEPCQLPTEGWCGYLRSSGWGPFEAIALAEYMNITAMTTLSHTESPQDLADLVSYMYAEPTGSHWGALRAQDGHPEPYNTDQYFEIGNEIDT
jgi:alpha-N-arabinofuranosidase